MKNKNIPSTEELEAFNKYLQDHKNYLQEDIEVEAPTPELYDNIMMQIRAYEKERKAARLRKTLNILSAILICILIICIIFFLRLA